MVVPAAGVGAAVGRNVWRLPLARAKRRDSQPRIGSGGSEQNQTFAGRDIKPPPEVKAKAPATAKKTRAKKTTVPKVEQDLTKIKKAAGKGKGTGRTKTIKKGIKKLEET